jgi:hypothetical protein
MPQAMELLPDHNVHTRLSDAKKKEQSKLKTIQKRPQSRIRPGQQSAKNSRNIYFDHAISVWLAIFVKNSDVFLTAVTLPGVQ